MKALSDCVNRPHLEIMRIRSNWGLKSAGKQTMALALTDHSDGVQNIKMRGYRTTVMLRIQFVAVGLGHVCMPKLKVPWSCTKPADDR